MKKKWLIVALTAVVAAATVAEPRLAAPLGALLDALLEDGEPAPPVEP